MYFKMNKKIVNNINISHEEKYYNTKSLILLFNVYYRKYYLSSLVAGRLSNIIYPIKDYKLFNAIEIISTAWKNVKDLYNNVTQNINWHELSNMQRLSIKFQENVIVDNM